MRKVKEKAGNRKATLAGQSNWRIKDIHIPNKFKETGKDKGTHWGAGGGPWVANLWLLGQEQRRSVLRYLISKIQM